MWKSPNTRFIFSPEAAEESSQTCSTVSRQSAPSRSKNTREQSSDCDSPACRSGTTCGPFAPIIQSAPECSQTYANTATRLSLPEAFRARIFRAREKAQAYAAREADFGRNTRVSFARFDPVSYSWKIPHFLFQGDLATYSQTWPRWGMMVRGACFRLPPWVQDMSVNAFGELSGAGIEAAAKSTLWPTVTVHGNGNRREYGGKSGDGLDTAVKRAGAKSAPWPTPTVRDSHGITQTGKPIDLLVYAVERGETKSREYPAAKSAPWPTPKCRDCDPTSRNQKPRDDLKCAVEMGATKSHLYPTVGTQTMGGKDTDTANCGLLNPDWVEWLMGWPFGWTDIAITSGVFYWLDLSDDPADWTPPLMARITTRKKHRAPRIETLGNGQVPLCAAVAFVWGFEILRVIVGVETKLKEGEEK